MRLNLGLAAVLAACGGGLVACGADQGSLAPQPDVRLSLHPGGALSVPYVVCDGNLSYSDSALIGPSGGRIAFGPHVLIVPSGALLTQTMISAQVPASDTIDVQLQPQNLTFAVQATLELSYEQCSPQPSAPVTIISVNDQLNTLLGTLPSTVSSATEAVSAPISQLGVYAIGTK